MDLEYVNLLLSIIALVSSFVSHLRHSRCCYGLIDIDMKTSRQNSVSDEITVNATNEIKNFSG